MDWHTRMSRALRTATAAARAAGVMLLKEWTRLTQAEIAEKGPGDYVTRLDREAERLILDRIREDFPGDAIVSEEAGGTAPASGHFWVVDPLDGTTNLIHRIPRWGISIALVSDGRPAAGVVFDPLHDELFSCKRDEGVWLNGTPISVSTIRDIGRAVVATGLPARHRQLIPSWSAQVRRVAGAAGPLRKTGSAALDLASVACGRFDAYFEPALAPWDTAAGVLLVEAAGGIVTDYAGGDWTLEGSGVIAANPDLHRPLVELIAEPAPSPR